MDGDRTLKHYYRNTKYYADRIESKYNLYSLEDGILKYKIPYTTNYDYYLVFVAGYALGNFEYYIDKKEDKYKHVFLSQCNWFIKNSDDGIYYHHFTFPYFKKFQDNWISGLGQSLMISALIRAYELTSKQRYITFALKAFSSFEKEIGCGGVRYLDGDDVWLEEYGILPPPHILNGFLYIIFGLNELYEVTKNKSVGKVKNIAISTVVKNLSKFDNGFYSLYDLLRKYPSTYQYHLLHTDQMMIMFDITGYDIFDYYYKRWKLFSDSWVNNKRASIKRGLIHLSRYGFRGSVSQYKKRKKWQQ